MRRSLVPNLVRRARVALVGALAIAVFAPTAAHAADPSWTSYPAAATTPVFVSGSAEFAGATNDPLIGEKIVQLFGGRVLRRFDVNGAFLADVPTAYVPALQSLAAPTAATRMFDCVNPVSTGQRLAFAPVAFDEQSDSYSVTNIARAMGAEAFWTEGAHGQGIDVALIDTGVAPVGPFAPRADGTASPALLSGPDLSFDSQVAELAHNDTFGHGTHMAGIINGVAPKSRVVSLKVGDATGAVDVTQVIAAVDWVREHKNTDGMNIRVLNLSYGIVSGNDKTIDELSKAIDAAWRAGIVVLASTGNDGR
jgi:serine protease AprX